MDAGIAVFSGMIILGAATKLAGAINEDKKQLITGVCMTIVGGIALIAYLLTGYQA